MKTPAGEYPLVVTALSFKTADNYDFDCEAVCVPLVSSTGHGNASMHRVHYVKGKFALSNILCALIIKDKAVLNAKFLFYLLMAKKDSYFVPLMKGTSNVSLTINQIGSVAIPLPPIHVQELLVDSIEKVRSRLEEINLLRAEQAKDINNLVFSKYTNSIRNAKWLPMKDVAPIHRQQLEIDPDEIYFRIGVRSFGRGVFENPSFKGSELTWQKIFRMTEGDLLFSNANGWEGAVGLVPEKYDGWVGSHRYITCLPNLSIINPEFLYYYFKTNEGVGKLSQASPGTVARTRTLNTKLLMQIEVPVPSLELQKEFVELLKKTDDITEDHKRIEKELTQFMPSLLDKAFKGELYSDDRMRTQKGKTLPTTQEAINLPLPASSDKDDLELAIIVALIESKLGNSYGEVGIQKTVFNIEAFNPVLSRKYNFVNYHYGTYSAELKERIKSNPFLGKKIVKGNEVFTISPDHKKAVLNAITNNANVKLVLSINQLLDIYTTPFIGKHTDRIELLNTVTKLIIDLQTTDLNIIYEGMKQWEIKQQGCKSKADKFDVSQTSKAIDLLISTDLIKKLLNK